MTEPKKDPPLLHVYPHDQWHGQVYIVGNADGLRQLKFAVDRALEGAEKKSQSSGSADAFVSDGEGYSVIVIRADSPWNGLIWNKLAVPYTEEMAAEKNPDALRPWNLETS